MAEAPWAAVSRPLRAAGRPVHRATPGPSPAHLPTELPFGANRGSHGGACEPVELGKSSLLAYRPAHLSRSRKSAADSWPRFAASADCKWARSCWLSAQTLGLPKQLPPSSLLLLLPSLLRFDSQLLSFSPLLLPTFAF